MKKQYIRPEFSYTIVVTEPIMQIAGSLENTTSAVVDGDGNLNNEVKRNDYNVWDDDWSR